MRRLLAVLAAAVLLPGMAACQDTPPAPYPRCTVQSTFGPAPGPAHWRLPP